MARRKDDTPKGGWLGPPSTEGLAPIGTLMKGNKFKPIKLTDKQKKKHDKFQKAMKKADKKGVWRW